MRTGTSRLHGVAAGPMTPVVQELKALPDEDVRAMAVYLASFNENTGGKPAQEALAERLERTTGTRIVATSPAGQRFYEGACAVCHAVGGPPLFGSRPSLALNSNVHAATPDNLIQVILHGIMAPVFERSRLYAGLPGRPVRRPARRARGLSPAAICAAKAGLDRDPGRDHAYPARGRGLKPTGWAALCKLDFSL